MSSAKAQMNKLYAKAGGRCHYCNRRTVRGGEKGQNKGNLATRDHVVPKYMGGPNSLENYVLACHKCNSERGNQLHYCDCLFCASLIREALNNQKSIDKVFYALVDFNKPRIIVNNAEYATRAGGKFAVKVGHNPLRHFATHEEALDYAINGEHMNRKAYK